MICALHTLKKIYMEKDIYIWNINRDSVFLFAKLFFRRIDIKGFVTDEEEYVGEMYMNRPILALEQVIQNDNSILLVSDEVSENRKKILPETKVLLWSDALEMDSNLKQHKIIIYGTGYGADQLEKNLLREGIEVSLYCVTKINNDTQYKGKKIIEVTELEEYDDYCIIISVMTDQYRKEILQTLYGFSNYIYEKEALDVTEDELWQMNLIQGIDKAVKNNKKIYLYSKKDVWSELIEEVLSTYGIEVSGYVYASEDRKQNIESLFSVAFEGIEDKFIIINETWKEHFVKARENVELAGFSWEAGNYTGFQMYTLSDEVILGKWKHYRDALVLNTIPYTKDKPGWRVYGNEEDEAIKIMILGGSTSAEYYHVENWISRLYKKLIKKGIRATIYNGAHPGEDIVDEILRLLRDGYILAPHIVISMSGVNNTSYKDAANQFNEINILGLVKSSLPDDGYYCSGVYSGESLYSFWQRNMKLLKVITEFYGAEFLGFLQPMNIGMLHMDLWEKSVFELEKHIEAAREFRISASDGKGYVNLIDLFEHRNEMYFDLCHYTDRGHEIIANKVFESIMPVIQGLNKGI